MDQAAEIEGNTKRPSLFWLVTEVGRAITELGFSVPYRKFIHKDKLSDGHPVLVLPGFMAGDTSTAPIRKFTNKLGYTSLDWGLGRNYAREEYIPTLIEKLDHLYDKYNQEVTLIGWSLGGVYARQIAKARPELIRQIITLGSPFLGISEPNNVAWIYNYISGGKRVSDINQNLLADIPIPAPVPTTAIYTKQDGIVPWQLCLENDEDDLHQNIEVRGSHLGLGVNPTVLNIIADRLRYEKLDWTQFRANRVKEVMFYPSL